MQTRLALGLLTSSIFAADYTFLKIAETGPESPYVSVGAHALSNNGIVALTLVRKDGEVGFYTAKDGNLTKLINTSGELAVGIPSGVNASGTVALNAELDDGSGGVFTLDASGLKAVVKGAEAGAQPFINDSGATSFVVKLGPLGLAGGSKIVISSGGSLRTLAEQTGELAGLWFWGAPLNNRGRVVFQATDILLSRGGIYIGGDVPLTKIVSASDAVKLGAGTPMSINDNGAVAFPAVDWTRGIAQIYIFENGALRTFASSSPSPAPGTFKAMLSATINNSGAVAFVGFGHPGSPSMGIYTGPDPSKDKVVAIGDPLFGSTAVELDTSGSVTMPRYMDDQGRVLFNYALADGRRGAALAVPGAAGPGDAPALTSGTVTNGASYQPGIVPGSWAQVKGARLSPVERIWQHADFNNGINLPTSLSGIEVRVNNLPAPVYYISPSQISFQVPSGITGTVNVQVVRNGVASNAVEATVTNSAPGLFAYAAGGKTYPAAVFANSPLIVGDPAVSGGAVRKAAPLDRISLYATGLAPSQSGVVVGTSALSGVTATIGPQAATVEFAGLVAVGQYQVNIVVPSLPEGEYPIMIRYNGQASQAGILIPIGK